MGNANNVRMGVCNVTFGGSDLGYTKGFVKVNFSSTDQEKTVDQEDAPIDKIIKEQNLEVVVPLAEHDLDKLATLLPSCVLVEDPDDASNKKLVMSGAAGGSLLTDASAELIVTPTDGGNEDILTVFHAVPKPNFNTTYDKDNLRVYEITFTALVGDNGFFSWGDSTILNLVSVSPTTGVEAGGTAVTISGFGFLASPAPTVKFGEGNATSVVRVDTKTITCVAPAGASTVDVIVRQDTKGGTLKDAFTYTGV